MNGIELRTVFARALRDQRRGVVGWSIGVAVTVLLMGAIWPSFNDIDMEALLSQYPEAMRELFNIKAMSTGAGYMNAELFSFMLPAMFIIFAVSRGARAIAGEEEDGTLEVLATLPVTRRTILLQKGAALLVGLAILTGALFGSLCVASLAFGLDIPVVDAAVGALSMFLLGLEFGLLAVALGAITGRRALTIGVAASVAGGAYLIYLAAQLVEQLRFARAASPFYQATVDGPIGSSFPPIALLMVVVGVAAIAVAAPLFERRDLGC